MKDKVGTILSEKPTLLKLKSLRYKDLRAGGGRGRKSLSVNGLGVKKQPLGVGQGVAVMRENVVSFVHRRWTLLHAHKLINYIKQAFSRF